MRLRLSGVYCSVKDKVGYGTIKSFLNGQGTLKPGGANSGAGAEAPAEGGKTHAAAKIRGGGRGQKRQQKEGKQMRRRAAEAPAEGGKPNAAAKFLVGGRRRKLQQKEGKRMRRQMFAWAGGGGSASGRRENESGGKVSRVGGAWRGRVLWRGVKRKGEEGMMVSFLFVPPVQDCSMLFLLGL